MRVGVIAPPWLPVPPPAYGGTESVLDVLVRGLEAGGHDVLLYATGDSAEPVPTAWTYQRAAGMGLGVGSVVVEVAHVLDAYEAMEDADIVHDHTVVGPLHAEHRSRVPVVTTNHGPFDGPLARLYRFVAPRVPIIAISYHQASTAMGIPIAAVIHHGLDVRATPVGAGNGGYALFLGRMCPNKGVDTAARVARAAGIPLLIAAKMQERLEQVYFRERVEPLLGGDVEYIGEVSGEARDALLRRALCLLNPIAWPEPFGMVMIEALAVGTPVVATPCGSVPEIVDDGVTGFLRPDVAGLVAALCAVDGLDRAACRRAAEERFSAEHVTAAHLRLYERTLCRLAS